MMKNNLICKCIACSNNKPFSFKVRHNFDFDYDYVSAICPQCEQEYHSALSAEEFRKVKENNSRLTFNVSFQYSATTYCTNIVIANNVESVEKHYSKYEWFNITLANKYDVEMARKKGMPIIEL